MQKEDDGSGLILRPAEGYTGDLNVEECENATYYSIKEWMEIE